MSSGILYKNVYRINDQVGLAVLATIKPRQSSGFSSHCIFNVAFLKVEDGLSDTRTVFLLLRHSASFHC